MFIIAFDIVKGGNIILKNPLELFENPSVDLYHDKT